MTKRLSDFKIENRKLRSTMASQLLSISFNNNEATKRIIIHSASFNDIKKKFKS